MQTTVAAHATTAIILSTIITTSHHHISASYIVTDRLSPGDAACPGTSYNIYNCEWIKIYTSGVFFVISVMTDVYVIASRRTVRLCSPILPIGSLKWQRSFRPQRHRIPEQRRRGRDWQDRCRTTTLLQAVAAALFVSRSSPTLPPVSFYSTLSEGLLRL